MQRTSLVVCKGIYLGHTDPEPVLVLSSEGNELRWTFFLKAATTQTLESLSTMQKAQVYTDINMRVPTLEISRVQNKVSD